MTSEKKAKTWEMRVSELEAKGATRSDAQAVVDAEDLTGSKIGALDKNAVYIGDNGRAFCGTMKCAGMTAFLTGRDISGQKVIKISKANGVVCNYCGKEPAR